MKTRREEAADEGRAVSRERSERKRDRPFQENSWKAKEGMEDIGLDTRSLLSGVVQMLVFYATNIILPAECNLGDLSTALGRRNLQSSFSVFWSSSVFK